MAFFSSIQIFRISTYLLKILYKDKKNTDQKHCKNCPRLYECTYLGYWRWGLLGGWWSWCCCWCCPLYHWWVEGRGVRGSASGGRGPPPLCYAPTFSSAVESLWGVTWTRQNKTKHNWKKRLSCRVVKCQEGFLWGKFSQTILWTTFLYYC